jgi:membrane-associated phospholipid phosphatase
MQLRSIALNAMMTEPTKLFAGNLRPDFIARLERSGVAPPANPKAFVHFCNVTELEVVEGRKSFPSGHTSTSFAAMVPLALFLVRRIGTFESGHGSTLRLLAGALPIALAFAVGVSRNRDEWHHFVDILAGAVIGVAAGVASYFLSMQAIPVADRRVRDGSTTADDTPRPFEAPRRAAPLVGPW